MNANRHIFHLSIPVADLDAAAAFYQTRLGATLGRRTGRWLDVLLWGHQITLQHDPDAVTDLAGQGQRHFGVVLPWDAWQALAPRLAGAGDAVVSPPIETDLGPSRQAKLFLRDPSNNVIEIKAYSDFPAVLGTDDPAYDSNRLG